MSRWFRFYDEVLDDPKAQRLEPVLFKTWVNLLCLTSKGNGVLPGVPDIAFALRLSEEVAKGAIDTLVTMELLDRSRNGLVPHNWNGRQYKNDVSTERVKRFRKRRETVSETPSESESDTEQNRAESGAAGAATPPGDSRLGSRLPEDWKPDKDLEAWAKATRPDLTFETVLADFRDFWLAKPGAAGRKLDWPRTFKRWVRNEKQNRAVSAPPKFGPKEFKPVDRDGVWKPRLEMFAKSGTWLSSWGPKPGEPHCEVPRHLMEAA